MPLTAEDAYKAWAETVGSLVREPTAAEIAAFMPEEHPLPLEKMTVGDYLDFKNNLWKAEQVRQIVNLLIRETAFARRNEHHQLARIFGKEVYEALPETVKEAIKARFAELSEAVKEA